MPMNVSKNVFYITNMNSDDFIHVLLTVIIIFVRFLVSIEGIYLLLGKFSTTIYSKKIIMTVRVQRLKSALHLFVI